MSSGNEDKITVGQFLSLASFVLVLLVLALGAGCYGCPKYKVYSQGMEGEALLKKAESERQVQIEDARGREQAAKMLANAEIERARGVAEANRIIGESLKNNPLYLVWLWVEKVADNQNSVIYVPTEAGLPILEAGRGIGPRPGKPAAEAPEKK